MSLSLVLYSLQMPQYKSSELLITDDPKIEHSFDHQRPAKSLPVLIPDGDAKFESEEDRKQVLESLVESHKCIGKALPIIFRRSSTERIIVDFERAFADPAPDQGSHNRLGHADRRPQSAQSQQSVNDPGQLRSITLTWTDITVRVGEPSKFTKLKRSLGHWNQKRGTPYKEMDSERPRILKNVNGVASPGRLLAIMGASGSGKTTLLNVLTYRNTGHLAIEGHVRVNGEIVGSRMRKIAAYVQQDDLFIATLKVREHLMFQAKLRLGKKLSQAQRVKRVDDVISDLGLAKCQKTIIGGSRSRTKGISGGERKRLAFASEVLTDPPLLFCDEPTSGLDSFMAVQTIEVLKKLARRGKTLVCTIHQPSSQVFELFDDLCLLADGRVAFLGPAKEAKAFFDSLGFPCPPNFNPADHYIRTLAITPGHERQCKQSIKKICRGYEESESGGTMRQTAANSMEKTGNEKRNVEKAMKKVPKYKSSWIQQFNALLWRSWIGNLREPMLVPVRFMQTIIISVLLGLVYYDTKLEGSTGVQNVNGLLFLFVTNMTFQYFFAVVNVFCEELPVFLREHFSSIYRVDTYFLSKIVSELPQYIIFPFIFSAILYFMTGLEPNAAVFFILCGITILTANVAVSLGYALSCMFADLSIALSVSSAVIIPFMLFGGFYINMDSVPVYFVWLQYLSYFKYSFEALAINQYNHVENIPGCGANATCPASGPGVLEMLSISPDLFAVDIIVLVVMIVVIRLIGFLALLGRTYVRKD